MLGGERQLNVLGSYFVTASDTVHGLCLSQLSEHGSDPILKPLYFFMQRKTLQRVVAMQGGACTRYLSTGGITGVCVCVCGGGGGLFEFAAGTAQEWTFFQLMM